MSNPVPDGRPTTAEKSTPGYFPWVRLWVDLPGDPKFRTVARASKQPLCSVLAVFMVLLTDAANGKPRGQFRMPVDDLASALDLEPEAVQAILDAMQGRLLNGCALTGWDARQPRRERPDGYEAERSHKRRDKPPENQRAPVVVGDIELRQEIPTATDRHATATRPPATASDRQPTAVRPPLDVEVDVEVELDAETEKINPPGLEHLALTNHRRRGSTKVRPVRFRYRSPGGPPEAGDSDLEPFMLQDGTEAVCSQVYADRLKHLFPHLDLASEFRGMSNWSETHVSQRKTQDGASRFVSNWLGRSQNRGGGVRAATTSGHGPALSTAGMPKLHREYLERMRAEGK